MKFIKGITFAPFYRKNTLNTEQARESFDYMIENTGADFVILAPGGLQDTAHSEEICYSSNATFSDEELADMICYAKKKGVRVGLKPTVNCKNGEWRAYISFFEHDVPCEPKWGNWFSSYTKFQTHYAEIAQKEECDMLIAGCEMVMSEHREKEWREVIAAIRECYDGTVSYNTDKYQEDRVKWWDCVDVISSSGYYPIDDWDNQLDRIEQVVKKFDKPFFFAEAGCMSVKGSNQVPNDWGVRGDYDEKGQADWFQAMFDACEKRDWVGGFGIWEWAAWHGDGRNPVKRGDYEVYGKAAADIIYRKFPQVSE